MNEKPLVSIIMSVYNGAKWLPFTINSILEQHYCHWEFLIIDDGSSDETREILALYEDNAQCKIFYNSENKGLIHNLNFLVQQSQGKYIARIDADDIAFDDRIDLQVSFLEKHSDVDVLATTIVQIDENGKQIGTWKDDQNCITHSEIKKRMPFANCIAHPSVMCRAAILKENPYLYSQKNAEDWDLWLQLLCKGVVFAKIKEPKLYYRIHQQSVTQQSLIQKAFYKNKIFYKHFFSNQQLIISDVSFFRKIKWASKLNRVKLFLSNLKSSLSN